ncbi:MAG: tetratricopeptide repeat protein [Pseudomonadota bacterium]
MSSPPPDTGLLLQQAVALHQRGDLQQAETLYAAVLRREPRNFDALNLMGVLARQGGATEDAIALIRQAIAADPGKAIAHCNLGAVLQDAQRHQEALDSFERALSLQPAYPMALCNRGNALRKLGRLEQALASYDAALALTPVYPEALCNRGVALQALGRAEEALHSFGRALENKPDHAPSYCGAAVALQSLGRYDEAQQAYRDALEIDPDYAEAWRSYGTLQQRIGNYQAALDSQERALRIAPASAPAHLQRANALRALGRNDDAVAAYRDALACGADPEAVGFQLAALGAQAAPPAPPPSYIAALFDQYAGDFDQHLQRQLQYRAPQLLFDALAVHLPDSAPGDSAPFDVLDLGCGTGLCGALLRPLARTLTGVDLSPQMLEQARRRQLYDELVCTDVTAFLQARPASCDLAVAADVFVYLGDLQPVFRATRHALRAGGLFAFSVEEEMHGDFALRPSGRYAHSRSYLQELADAHGYAIVSLAQQVLRQDQGQDVSGLIALLRKDGA